MKSNYNLLLGGIILLFSACSGNDGGPSGLVPLTIAGEWEATRAQFTLVSNPQQMVEVVAMGGAAVFEAGDERFIIVIMPLNENPQIVTGQYRVANSLVEVEYDDDPDTTVLWDVQISGDQLFIRGPIKFDFDHDGTFQEANGQLDFVKK